MNISHVVALKIYQIMRNLHFQAYHENLHTHTHTLQILFFACTIFDMFRIDPSCHLDHCHDRDQRFRTSMSEHQCSWNVSYCHWTMSAYTTSMIHQIHLYITAWLVKTGHFNMIKIWWEFKIKARGWSNHTDVRLSLGFWWSYFVLSLSLSTTLYFPSFLCFCFFFSTSLLFFFLLIVHTIEEIYLYHFNIISLNTSTAT